MHIYSSIDKDRKKDAFIRLYFLLYYNIYFFVYLTLLLFEIRNYYINLFFLFILLY